jgi:hypothetical protein
LDMRLFVLVKGDEIVVTSLTGFRAAYLKRPNHPQLIFGGELKTMTNYCLLRRGRQQPQRRVSWGGLFRKWAHTARHHTPHGERVMVFYGYTPGAHRSVLEPPCSGRLHQSWGPRT